MLVLIIPIQAQAHAGQTLQKFRVAVDGKAYQASGTIGSQDGELYLPPSVIKQLLGALPTAAVKRNEAGYASLKGACDEIHASYYEYDSVLKAAYIWKDLGDKGMEEARIGYYGLGTPSNHAITYKQFFSILDHAVEIADDTKLAAWESKFALGRNSDKVMTRFEGMMAILNAATLLGPDFSEFNANWTGLNERIGEKVWDELNTIPNPYEFIPNHYPYALGGFQNTTYVYDWDDCGVAYRYAFGRVSLVSGKLLFDYDENRNSMRPADTMTFTEALNATARFLDSREQPDQYISLSSNEALNYDQAYLTDNLLNKSMALPGISDENLPQWHGFVLPGGSYEETDIDTVLWDRNLRKIADWGFNSVRYMLTYQTLFDAHATQVNLANLRKLDMVVASAIKYNLHLNIVTFSLPGRWTKTDFDTYTSTGSLDLFTNTEEQEEAKAVWALIAKRYRNIPSASLSFCPLWEATNTDLSSGLPVDPYTITDVSKVYCDLIGAIRENDPDRFIVYEPTCNNNCPQLINEAQEIRSDIEDQYNDVLMISNFCEQPFVYAEMTAVQGEHIDHNNHSMFKPAYPVTVYAAQQRIPNGSPLNLNGALVAGTVIDIYLSKAEGSGTFKMTADGAELYSETLSDTTYHTDNPLSRFYPYAKSDKHIRVTLPSDTDHLQISYSGDAFSWSGLDVTLPQGYAVNRWWYMSFYDADMAGTEWAPPALKPTSRIMISPFDRMNGRNITIHPDITYTTDEAYDRANKQTVENWGEAMADFSPNLLVRAERACFCIGSEYESSIQYYDDFLTMCDEHGFSWFSNDYIDIFSNSSQTMYAGAEKDRYQDGYLLTDMLKVYQKHLPQPTTLEAIQYPISAAPNDSSRGSVTGGGTYDEGATATLHAERKTGYRFVRWTEGSAQASTKADYSFAVTGERNLTAEFAPLIPTGIRYSKTDATLYGAANGTISITASGGDSGTYQYSADGGARWQASKTFSVKAGTYTAMVRDAAYPENTAVCSVKVGQPSFMGNIPASKVPSKANAGYALRIVPSTLKGYVMKTVTYATSNRSVANVDAGGNVTFLSGGKATITITTVLQTVDKKGRTITKTVKVKKTITVSQPVATIRLNTTHATIMKTKSVKLIPAFAPSMASNKKVKWTSSNPRVATVSSSGVVTGKAGGTAVITCTAQDGSKVSASCTITVTPIYPTEIKLSKTTLTIRIGKTGALKATISPGNTDFKTVTWASSNPAIASVDSKGKIKGWAKGTATITVRTTNGYTASCTVTVK